MNTLDISNKIIIDQFYKHFNNTLISRKNIFIEFSKKRKVNTKLDKEEKLIFPANLFDAIITDMITFIFDNIIAIDLKSSLTNKELRRMIEKKIKNILFELKIVYTNNRLYLVINRPVLNKLEVESI